MSDLRSPASLLRSDCNQLLNCVDTIVMPAMPLRKHQLEDALTNRLRLIEPQFVLEKMGRKWSGSIISTTFKGKRDLERQQMLWDALKPRA